MRKLSLFRSKAALVMLCATGLIAAQCSPPVLSTSEAIGHYFGDVAPGTTKTKTITVTNSGGFDAILGDVSSSGLGLSPPYSLVGGSCATGLSVPAGGSCTLDVRFSPTTLAHALGLMILRYNWLNSNQADRRLQTLVAGNAGKYVDFTELRASDPVTTYSENGYTITTVSAAWRGPEALIFYTPASTTTVGEIRMTADDGGTFLFNSVGLYSSLTEIPFVIEGRLGSATVFSFSDTLPQTYGAFVTVQNPQVSDPIDTLVIRMTNTAPECCANPMGLDTIQTLRPSLP